jgi:hypothetical protein
VRHRHRIVTVAAVTTLVVVSGCGRDHRNPVGIENQSPTITLSGTNIGPDGAGMTAHALRWDARDVDGRVDHVEFYSGNRPPASGAAWVRVDGCSHVVRLRSAAARRAAGATLPAEEPAPEPTFVAVRAVDDRGAASLPAVRAFVDDNVAPTVQIVSPPINWWDITTTPTSLHVIWQGNDPDGSPPGHLASYRYKMFDKDTPEGLLARTDPDSLRRKYAPTYTGWDSLPGDSTSVVLRNVVPYVLHVFVVVGFDAQGASTAPFDPYRNMLGFFAYPGVGPRFTISSEGFDYAYRSGGFSSDSSWTVNLRAVAPAVRIQWSATPPAGSALAGYRWAVDIADLNDETPRRNANDVRHWSAWSLGTTSAEVSVVKPTPPSTTRRLYIEAVDDLGNLGDAIVKVIFNTTQEQRPLLIVNDTRMPMERTDGAGNVLPLGRSWPNYGELDSFFVARGGVPWQGYPTGTQSAPGLFAGYDFDVYRARSPSLDKTVPLDLLLRYRSVVWLIDAGVANFNPPDHLGMYALRYMSSPGRQNTLAAFVAAGGRAWLVGGGAAFALCRDLGNRSTNDTYTFVYSNAAGELVPGRFMYDLTHWRSELSVWAMPAISAHPLRTIVRSPGELDYSRLPSALAARSAATDPVPPRRTLANFYPALSTTAFEYLTLPNDIVESISASPGHGREASTLDTLYTIRGVLPASKDMPCMTVYHGRDNGQLVFTGFDLWTWSRPQCRALVDAVLADLWHLSPATAASGDDAAAETSDAMVKRNR